MAPSVNYLIGLKITALIFVFFFTVLPPKSVEAAVHNSGGRSFKQSKVGLGSRPPLCVNKCLNCRPCMASLIVPPNQKTNVKASPQDEDDNGYYLVTWRCRCGDKVFYP